jgi:hypothetical protein
MRQAFLTSIVQVADYAQQIERGRAPPIEEATREAAATLAGFLSAKPPTKTVKPTRKKS